MKKTFTVNISGTVFHIDEDAYFVLNDYLESIKHHFATTEGREEIIADFENRICEMLQERIENGKQVITIDDVEKVIEVLGVPEDFEEEDKASTHKRNSENREAKRLYRDPDHKLIAGVCAGLGAYFHTDPLWFRLAFVISMFPMLGTSILVYVILWVVIPEATTTADKLRMRGEKVNIKNIEKSIKEEISDLKDKFKDFTKEAKRTVKKKSVEHQSELERIGGVLFRILEVLIKVVLIFVGVILTLVGISLIIAFILFFFDTGHHVLFLDSESFTFSFSTIYDLIFGPSGYNPVLQFGLLTFLGIPLIMLLFAGIKLIFGIRNTRTISIIALSLWIAGLVITSVFSFKYIKDFHHEGSHQEMIEMMPPLGQVLYLDVKNDHRFNEILEEHEHLVIDEDDFIISTIKEDPFYGIPDLTIKQYKGSLILLEINYEAYGRSIRKAKQRAENIIYHLEQTDEGFIFDPYFKIPEDDVWRLQDMQMVLSVPEGTFIQTSTNLQSILNNDDHHRISGKLLKMEKHKLNVTHEWPSPKIINDSISNDVGIN